MCCAAVLSLCSCCKILHSVCWSLTTDPCVSYAYACEHSARQQTTYSIQESRSWLLFCLVLTKRKKTMILLLYWDLALAVMVNQNDFFLSVLWNVSPFCTDQWSECSVIEGHRSNSLRPSRKMKNESSLRDASLWTGSRHHPAMPMHMHGRS